MCHWLFVPAITNRWLESQAHHVHFFIYSLCYICIYIEKRPKTNIKRPAFGPCCIKRQRLSKSGIACLLLRHSKESYYLRNVQKWSDSFRQRTLTRGCVITVRLIPVYFVRIQLLCLSWMNNSFTWLVTYKPVRYTVILPPMLSVLCFRYLPWSQLLSGRVEMLFLLLLLIASVRQKRFREMKLLFRRLHFAGMEAVWSEKNRVFYRNDVDCAFLQYSLKCYHLCCLNNIWNDWNMLGHCFQL